jgi:RimJ/RimL family protein N-acetyltransferase
MFLPITMKIVFNMNNFLIQGDLDFSLQSQRVRLLRSIIEADRQIAYRFSVITEDRKMIGVVKITRIFDDHQHICDISFSIDKSLLGLGYNLLIINRATSLAFHEYHFRKATMTFLSNFEPGQKAAVECGYSFVGILKQNEKIFGQWRDFALFEKVNPELL